MRKNIYTNVDSLIQGIETILSENRYSFSDDEKVLLTDTLSFLKKSKKIGSENPIDWSFIMKGLELLARVFSDSDGFPNIF